MKQFWTHTTIGILILTLILPIIIIFLGYIHKIEGYAISGSTSTSAALLALLGVMYSNFKSEQNIEKQLKINQNNKYIELRFYESKKAIEKLMEEIQITLTVYKTIKKLREHSDICNISYLKQLCILIIQFINIISNLELISNLPYIIRKDFEKGLENKIDLKNKNIMYNKILLDNLFKIIVKYEKSHFVIPYSKEYENIIKKFIESEQLDTSKILFALYYYSPITEEELYDHFKNTLNKIAQNIPEELILEGKKRVGT